MTTATDRRRRARRLLGVLAAHVPEINFDRHVQALVLAVIEAHVRAFRARPGRAKKGKRR